MKRLWLCLFLLSSSTQADYYSATPKLPALAIDGQKVTLSGISSGAFFAVQYAVAHSSKIAGVASIAGGIYYCSEGDALRASRNCMKEPQNLDIARVQKYLSEQNQAGLIDDPSFIRRQKVFVFQGQKDSVVLPPAGDKLIEFYEALGVNVLRRLDVPSGHGFPSEQVSNPCEANQKPWMNNCAYDGAGEVLKAMYGSLQVSRPMKRQNLMTFDQIEFETLDATMESEAHIYIPESCRQASAKCPLHVVFHGCQQSPEKVGDQFIALAGYNEWAEGNGIVILYPAVSTSKMNPNGCWDWFGYTGKDFALRQAKQIVVVHKMIERLKQTPASLRKN